MHSVPNVIILSSDHHGFAAIEFNGDEHANGVLEFSTSPMSRFYTPFAPFAGSLKKATETTVKRVKTELVKIADSEELDVVTTELEYEMEATETTVKHFKTRLVQIADSEEVDVVTTEYEMKITETIVKRVKTELKIADSEEMDVITTEYEIPQENVIQYIATGDYKWYAQ